MPLQQYPFWFYAPTRLRIAILFVATCALSTLAAAQNNTQYAGSMVTLEATSTAPVTAAAEDAFEAQLATERKRILDQSNKTEADYLAQRAECYQRFSVNACLMQASGERNALIADLERQKVSVNDAERKRKGAEKLLRTEEKTAPKVLEALAERRGQFLQDDASRQQRAQDKAAKHNGTQAPEAANQPGPKPASNVNPARSNDYIKRQQRKKEQAQAQSEKKAQAIVARAIYDQRQQEAAQRKADALKKQQQKTKQPAAPLPLPPAIPGS